MYYSSIVHHSSWRFFAIKSVFGDTAGHAMLFTGLLLLTLTMLSVLALLIKRAFRSREDQEGESSRKEEERDNVDCEHFS